MAISFKGAHFPQDIILMGIRWYLAYPLSYRHVEELLEERGVLSSAKMRLRSYRSFCETIVMVQTAQSKAAQQR
jgi:transposase-like protein